MDRLKIKPEASKTYLIKYNGADIVECKVLCFSPSGNYMKVVMNSFYYWVEVAQLNILKELP